MNGTVIDASRRPDAEADADRRHRRAPRSPRAVIDLTPANATDPATPLTLIAGDGIGTGGAPIAIRGGGELTALNAPRIDDGDPSTTNKLDPAAHSGIFVHNTGSGDLTLANGRNLFGIQVTAGDGDIEITNDAGDLLVQTAVQTKPIPTPAATPGGDPIDNGPGGDNTFTVNPGNQVVLDPRLIVNLSSGVSIASGGKQNYNGDVALERNIAIAANGGVAVVGGLDSQDAATPHSLTATIADGTTFAVRDGVGAQHPLGALTLSSTLVGADDGPLVLDTPTVTTTGSQTYRADLSLAQQTSLTGGAVEFGGDVTSATAGLAVNAADEVLFSAAGDQSVTTAGNLTFAGRASVPIDASIAKPTGNLTLTSSGGSLILGDREKLSAGGSLALAGNTVRFTDLSALDIAVTSPDIQIFSRESGPVVLPGVREIFTDGGTDLLANTVRVQLAAGRGRRRPRAAHRDARAPRRTRARSR
jgi:hypothetical protein